MAGEKKVKNRQGGKAGAKAEREKEKKAAAAAANKDVNVESVADSLTKLVVDTNRSAGGVLTSQSDSRDVSPLF